MIIGRREGGCFPVTEGIPIQEIKGLRESIIANQFQEWVCKPSFVPAGWRVAIIYLGRSLPTGSPAFAGSDLPAGRTAPESRLHPGRVPLAPTGCLVLQAVGFALPATSPPPRCALTAPFHLCLCPEGPSAVCFLWHFPGGCPRWPLATTVPCPARTFLPASHEATQSDRPTHSWN